MNRASVLLKLGRKAVSYIESRTPERVLRGARYLLSTVPAAGLHWVFYVIFSLLGVQYLVASVIGFTLGTTLQYLLLEKWVFEYEGDERKRAVTIVAIVISTYFIAYHVGLSLIVESFPSFDKYVAAPVVMKLILAWFRYRGLKYAFLKRETKEEVENMKK